MRRNIKSGGNSFYRVPSRTEQGKYYSAEMSIGMCECLLDVMDLHVHINSSCSQRILQTPSTLFPVLAKINAKDLLIVS